MGIACLLFVNVALLYFSILSIVCGREELAVACSPWSPAGDIRISNQFLITRALHFALLRQAYYQASVTITLGRKV